MSDSGSANKHSGRRSFLKAGAGTVVAAAAAAGILEPLRHLKARTDLDSFVKTHYTRLDAEALERVLKRIEAEVARDYGAKVTVRDHKPMDGVEFGYALNLSRCNGSRKCVTACVKENNQSRDPEIQYIRVLELPKGSLNLEEGSHYYDHDRVPHEGKSYMPVQCQQCEKPPCTKVCPVVATWPETDGITVIDYEWCIGCRYCMAACPYEARRFNFSWPVIAKGEINPVMGYLSNRIRPRGVAEKCHFCLHRTREGKYPACMEACPTGARIFGNLLDPESEIGAVLRTKSVYVLKEDAGTIPRFFYYTDA